jgi:large subunit ribosomal protein L21
MYAVVKTGGKQYRVENDQKLLVERINADEGSVVTLSDILMVVDSGKISKGNELQNIAVSATVIKQTRGPKIITLKHRRRKNSRRVKGHRQDLTLLKVVGIGDPKKLAIKDEKKVTKEKVQKEKKSETTKITKKVSEPKVTKASTPKKAENVKAKKAITSSKKEK